RGTPGNHPLPHPKRFADLIQLATNRLPLWHAPAVVKTRSCQCGIDVIRRVLWPAKCFRRRRHFSEKTWRRKHKRGGPMHIDPAHNESLLLEQKAARLRIDSIRATTAAGSGHPTSCASAAEIMAVLFFSVMRYDPAEPHNLNNDKFVLSKGHAAPILYAAWAEAGAFPLDKLLTLRRIDSDLEGHPTPRLPFVDVATGSLGQGLS